MGGLVVGMEVQCGQGAANQIILWSPGLRVPSSGTAPDLQHKAHGTLDPEPQNQPIGTDNVRPPEPTLSISVANVCNNV